MAYDSDLVRTKNWGTEILTDADLEGQFDLIINWIMAAMNSTTGHNHDGSSNHGPKLTPANLVIASQAQGDILYASSATAWARLGAGTSGYFLKTQGAGMNPTWDAATFTPSVSNALSGSVIQTVYTNVVTSTTGTTQIPFDDTIPQNTEGDEYMTLAITPNNASNTLEIDVAIYIAHSVTNDNLTVALFQDSTAGALMASGLSGGASAAMVFLSRFRYVMTAGTTSSTTFKVRAGGATSGTTTFNGSGGARKYGGVLVSSIVIKEIKA